MTKLHQSKNLKKWKADNAVHLATTFGVDDGPHVSFVTGMRDSYHRANVELSKRKASLVPETLHPSPLLALNVATANGSGVGGISNTYVIV
jgi:hypothetical protein